MATLAGAAQGSRVGGKATPQVLALSTAAASTKLRERVSLGSKACACGKRRGGAQNFPVSVVSCSGCSRVRVWVRYLKRCAFKTGKRLIS